MLDVSVEQMRIGLDVTGGDAAHRRIHGERFTLQHGRHGQTGDGIARDCFYLRHHPHVFVVVVVAMEDKGSGKGAEPDQHLNHHIAFERGGITQIAPHFFGFHPIDADDLMIFQMDVSRMPPAASIIL